MSRQTELMARRVAAGKCRYCGREPLIPGTQRGELCAAQQLARKQRSRGTVTPGRRGRKPAAPPPA